MIDMKNLNAIIFFQVSRFLSRIRTLFSKFSAAGTGSGQKMDRIRNPVSIAEGIHQNFCNGGNPPICKCLNSQIFCFTPTLPYLFRIRLHFVIGFGSSIFRQCGCVRIREILNCVRILEVALVPGLDTGRYPYQLARHLGSGRPFDSCCLIMQVILTTIFSFNSISATVFKF